MLIAKNAEKKNTDKKIKILHNLIVQTSYFRIYSFILFTSVRMCMHTF